MSISRQQLVQSRLPAQLSPLDEAEAFAPSNIALCKYWGKRDVELNLPINNSLSVSLGHLGTRTRLLRSSDGRDRVWLNGIEQDSSGDFAAKLLAFIELFRAGRVLPVHVHTENNIPTAAGLASSASGFAALTLALDKWLQLALEPAVLSAFARLGSGSACRSLFDGFVEWQDGIHDDGMDSHGVPLEAGWPGLQIGLVKVATGEKAVGSRAGMQRTLETAHLYQSWPLQAAADLEKLHRAIETRDFALLGQTAEQNALSMHATMIASWPPLLYWQPESVAAMQRVWQLREQGLALYFTMDAGPNLKLLFEAPDRAAVEQAFAGLEVVAPFGD